MLSSLNVTTDERVRIESIKYGNEKRRTIETDL